MSPVGGRPRTGLRDGRLGRAGHPWPTTAAWTIRRTLRIPGDSATKPKLRHARTVRVAGARRGTSRRASRVYFP